MVSRAARAKLMTCTVSLTAVHVYRFRVKDFATFEASHMAKEKDLRAEATAKDCEYGSEDPVPAVMEVLLEIGDSHKELQVASGRIFKTVQEEIGAVVMVPGSDTEAKEKSEVILQRWSTKWNGTFVDIKSEAEIQNGDRLRVIPVPQLKPKHSGMGHQNALSVVEKVRKPNPSHAACLSKLFPASTVPLPSKGTESVRMFDPTGECVNVKRKRQKKGAITRSRPYKLWVVVGSEVFPSVPKAGSRRAMKKNGRVMKLEFNRILSKQEVKNVLLRNFPTLHLTKPTFMKAKPDNRMYRVELEEGFFPDGEELLTIASKESLYLVEGTEEQTELSVEKDSPEPRPKRQKQTLTEDRAQGTSSGSGNSDNTPTLLQKADHLLKQLRAPPPPAYHVISSESDGDDEGQIPSPVHQETLEHWHQLRQAQDMAYQESLTIDQEKARKAAEKRQRMGKLEQLRDAIKRKVQGDEDGTKICVAVRMLSGEKIQTSFRTSSTAVDLYEVVFAMGQMTTPFAIYIGMPRTEVPMSSATLQGLGLGGTLLSVEERDGNEADLLDLLNAPCEEEIPVSEHEDGGDFGEEQLEEWSTVLEKEDHLRLVFTDNYLPKVSPTLVKINRSALFHEVIGLYETNANIIHQFPLRVRFLGERAVDTGGVGRDLFSAFWEEVYKESFDGASLVTPAVHAHVNMASFSVLGKVLSHGYLSCGILPVRIAFPTLAAILLGPSQEVPSPILLQSFLDSLSLVDRSTVSKALATQTSSFPSNVSLRLVSIFSRFGCREIPSPKNISHLLLKVASHDFISRPFAAITLMSSGIPPEHKSFWQQKSVRDLFTLYVSLSVNPHKVIDQLEEPLVYNNPSEERVFGYLQQYVGNMKTEELRKFLRFVTGSSVCLSTKIIVSFNGLTGAARRPLPHTCACELELPYTYTTYLDFVDEFTTVLSEGQYCWEMQSV